MTSSKQMPAIQAQKQTDSLLHSLQFSRHRAGCKQLCIAIPLFAMDERRNLCKDIYPVVADYWGSSDWRTVEHAIRLAIQDAWNARDRNTWDELFPGCSKAPSNKRFIATLAARLTACGPEPDET